jgi:GAF domain-containing protein/HAMP domain-containing protein
MIGPRNPTLIGRRVTAEDLPDRRRALQRMAFFAIIVGAVVAALAGYVGLQVQTLPYGIISSAAILLVLLAAASLVLSRGGALSLAGWLLASGLGVLLPAIAASIAGTGVFLAVVGGLLLPALLRPGISGSQRRPIFVLSLTAGIVSLLIDLFNPAGRLALPIPGPAVLALNALLIGLTLIRIAQQFTGFDLRTKLIVAFLGVSLVPLALLSYLNDQTTRSAIEREANDKLFSAASQAANSLDGFFADRKSDLTTQSSFHAYHEYLSLPPDERSDSPANEEAKSLLESIASQPPAGLLSLGILDLNGIDVLDSRPANVGSNESDRIYFDRALTSAGPYASPVLIPGGTNQPSIFLSMVLRGEDDQPVGVIRAQYTLEALQSRIFALSGLAGEDSFAVVFDDQLIHIAHGTDPSTILKAVGPLDPTTEEQLIAQDRLPDLPSGQLTTNLPNLASSLQDANENPFFQAEDIATGSRVNQVAVAGMQQQPWLVAYFQPLDILFAPAEAQARNTLLLALALAAVISALAIGVAQVVSRPINQLTDVAARISEGDLDVEVPTSTDDELGMLAQTFNSMTFRLRSLISSLEERVQDRTESLERRARQLQAASDVAKDAAAVRDVDRLLREAVQRIVDRFGYYHAGVFLIEDDDFAVLRAASSAGGQRMLARGHKMAVGKVGLVGYVTGTGKPRVASDVGQDAVHFANPDLPDTRSEAALPLLVGAQIIGALDVQSTELDAFDEQDVIALQTMADQLAIAIENARLLTRQTELAADRRRAIDVYRELTGSLSYDQILADATRLIRAAFGYERVVLGLVEGADVVIHSASAASQGRLPRLGQSIPVGQGLLGRAVSSLSPVRIDATSPQIGAKIDPALGEIRSSLCVPLISRGRPIGALAVERPEGWAFDSNDVELVELLASQSAVSIENARLFEETQQRLRQVDTLYRRQTAESWELLVNARRVQGQENLAAFGDEGSDTGLDPSEAIEAEISLRGETIGRLNVLPQNIEDWTEEDREILQDVANEVGGQLEQLRLMEEIQRRATQLETAAEIARVATGLLDLDPLLKRAVNLIQQRFGFYHVGVYLVEAGGQTAFIREASGDVGDALKQTRRRFEAGSRSVIGFVIGSGEYYVAHDTETDPYFKASTLLPQSQSELAVPLKIGERVIGALDVHDSGKYAFGEDDITALETLADQIAVAVENARLFQEAIQRAEREQNVVQITSKLRASQDIDSILQTAVSELRMALGASRATIRLADEPVPIGTKGNGTDRGESAAANDGVGMERETEADV